MGEESEEGAGNGKGTSSRRRNRSARRNSWNCEQRCWNRLHSSDGDASAGYRFLRDRVQDATSPMIPLVLQVVEALGSVEGRNPREEQCATGLVSS